MPWIQPVTSRRQRSATASSIPVDGDFDNYRGIFRGDLFSSALINSIGIGLITTRDRGARRDGGLRGRLPPPGKRLIAALLIAMFLSISLVTPLFNIERHRPVWTPGRG